MAVTQGRWTARSQLASFLTLRWSATGLRPSCARADLPLLLAADEPPPALALARFIVDRSRPDDDWVMR